MLLDIRLPDLDGIAVAKRGAQLPAPLDVVLVSSGDGAVYRLSPPERRRDDTTITAA